MRARSERSVFKKILEYSPDQIQQKFTVEDLKSCYMFCEKANSKHYVSVEKDRKESFWVPVNADFGFDRPAGSNNYKELIDVAKHMVQAFGLTLNW